MVDGTAFLKKLQLSKYEGGYGYKIKGDGPLAFPFGCDYYRDKDGTFVYQPKKYIEKMMARYDRHFQGKPKQATPPLPSDDHPELDDTPLLTAKDIVIFMSFIGMLQWLITLGRLDVMQAVTALSAFRGAPRQGHMDRAKRIFGYVDKYKEAGIRVRRGMPDYRELDKIYKKYYWSTKVYGTHHE